MKKKFNEWRSKLACKQIDILMIVSGIVVDMVFYVCGLGARKIADKTSETILNLEAAALTVLFIAGFVLIICGITMLIVDILDDFTRRRLLKLYKENLSKDEFIEVFFVNVEEGPAGPAGKFYWYSKNCSMPKWFAKWENDQIYVVLKDNDKFVKDWTISDLNFFGAWFCLPNTESCKKKR